MPYQANPPRRSKPDPRREHRQQYELGGKSHGWSVDGRYCDGAVTDSQRSSVVVRRARSAAYGYRSSYVARETPTFGSASRGRMPMTLRGRAFWLRSAGHGEIRPVTLTPPGVDEVLVRTLYSGVSRGTETLAFRGGVPPSQYASMRAPFQDGDFPGPVKYGYLNVGVVEEGPSTLLGRTVFCLYPHQTRYVVPATAVTVVPDAVPPARAVVAGTMETAVNALSDAW